LASVLHDEPRMWQWKYLSEEAVPGIEFLEILEIFTFAEAKTTLPANSEIKLFLDTLKYERFNGGVQFFDVVVVEVLAIHDETQRAECAYEVAAIKLLRSPKCVNHHIDVR